MAALGLLLFGLIATFSGSALLSSAAGPCRETSSACFSNQEQSELISIVTSSLIVGIFVALLARHASRFYLAHRSIPLWVAANSIGFAARIVLMRQIFSLLPEGQLLAILPATGICGGIFGCFQWYFLRPTLRHAFGWVGVTAAAWVIGVGILLVIAASG